MKTQQLFKKTLLKLVRRGQESTKKNNSPPQEDINCEFKLPAAEDVYISVPAQEV